MTFAINRRRLLLAGSAGLFASALPGRAFAAPTRGFTHGVASGEPSQTGAVLWTRYLASSPIRLRVEIADDPSFQRIVLTGEAEASPATDCCARAIAEGLAPGRWYHYRFVAPDGQASDTGRTRTLPDGDTETMALSMVNELLGIDEQRKQFVFTASVEATQLHLFRQTFPFHVVGYRWPPAHRVKKYTALD